MKDIYVEFRGKYKVDGESRDSEHKGWLEVNSWSHNIRQPKSATSSSVGTTLLNVLNILTWFS